MPLAPGSLLQGGKYRIIRFISSGGFGCTYEAVHTGLNGRMAIKEFFVQDICNRDDATGYVSVGLQSKAQTFDKLREKFIREAQSVFALSHPGIVHVSDVFEENGTAYFVMDYIDGCSLADLVDKNGPMDEATALGYMRQVCAALDYVHANGRLHLDIKPGNIMVDRAGRAVLIDFGASKQYDSGTGENLSTLLGFTPGFAPPEQMTADVSRFLPATDVYALGGTLYNLLTGEAPLSANHRYAGDELKPLPESVSPSTRRAIEAALQLSKSARPQSVAEFAALLFGGNAPQPQPKPQPTPAPAPALRIAPRSSNATVKIGTNPPRSDHPWYNNKKIILSVVAIMVVLVVFGIGFIVPLQKKENDMRSLGPHNLQLCAFKDGESRFFTVEQWNALPTADRETYSTVGVVVNCDDVEPFCISLYDSGESMTWNEAKERYGEGALPSREECLVIGRYYNDINSAIEAFGGDYPKSWYWGKAVDSDGATSVKTFNGEGDVYVYKEAALRVRTVAPVPFDMGNCADDYASESTRNVKNTTDVDEVVPACPSKRYGHSKYQNLDLATTLDGEPVFFTVKEWNAVPSDERHFFEKVGIVINYGGCPPFTLALHDNGKEITWNEAVSKYGESRLPSKSQCLAIAQQCDFVNKAIKTFGGDKDPAKLYWGKSYNSSLAWTVNMPNGYVNYNVDKEDTGRVRAVAPVPRNVSPSAK